VPDQKPPSDFVIRYFKSSLQVTVSPCWLLVFPSVISTSLSPDAKIHIPVELLRCIYPFLPKGYQSSFPLNKSTSTNPRTATSVRLTLTGLQSFLYVLASRFARHPDRSYRNVVSYIRQPCLLHPSTIQVVTFSHVGYTSRLNRVIDGMGLSPIKTYSLAGRILSDMLEPEDLALKR